MVLSTDWLRVLLTPGCWFQTERYSPEWEREILDRLAAGEQFRRDGQYAVTLGDLNIWVANHPYGSFTPGLFSGLPKGMRPRRSTILWLHDRMMSDLLTEGVGRAHV